MKRNLDENLKEIKTLNKQCSQYEELLEKLKKEARKIISDNVWVKLSNFIITLYFLIERKFTTEFK